jgi:hypothetical protein
MNDFVKRRMDWLVAIVADPTQNKLSLAVAVILVARYFNSATDKAWPGTRRLAEELKTDRRNLHRALDRLIASGHLDRKPARGRGNTDTYLMVLRRKRRPDDAFYDGEEEEKASTEVVKGVYRGRKRRPIDAETLEEPRMNPRNDDGARERSLDSGSREEAGSRRSTRPSKSTRPSLPSQRFRPVSSRTTFPPELKFGETHASEAARIAGWDRERAQKEFEGFRGWHLDHDTRQVEWDGAWQNWCRKEGHRRQRCTRRHPPTRAAKGLRGGKRRVLLARAPPGKGFRCPICFE